MKTTQIKTNMLILLTLCVTLSASAAVAQTVTTSGGTANSVPKFSGTYTLVNSAITESNGNVGIGTTSPIATLTISGDNNASGAWLALLGSGTGGNGWLIQSTDGTASQGQGNLTFFDLTNGVNPLTMTNSGNVGIGMTNPQTSLHVVTAPTTGLINAQVLQNPSSNVGDAVGINFKAESNNGSSAAPHVGKGALVYERTGGWGVGDFMFLQNTDTTTDSGPTLSNAVMTIKNSGNVGIGTTAPGAKLEINGNIKLSSGSGASLIFPDGTVQSTAWSGTLCGGDYAESVNAVGGKASYEPGDVLVIGEGTTADVTKSTEPYSILVAGIYSTKPGLVGRRQTGESRDAEIPMAMVGIVPTKVSAENGPIKKGDLLVTASTPGYAMKGTDRSRMLGAVVGKALGNLDSGAGVVEVLVSLQ